VARALRGAFPPVDLRAVCFVRAISNLFEETLQAFGHVLCEEACFGLNIVYINLAFKDFILGAMFTSKTTSAKKSKKQTKQVRKCTEVQDFAHVARLQYDELVKQRARTTSEKKISDLDERIRDHIHVNEIQVLLKFHTSSVIANNVTFGRINANKEEPTQYGFTCVLSKKGDTEIIPVSSMNDIMPFASAKSMVTNGALVQSYKEASRSFVSSEVNRLKETKLAELSSAMRIAAAVEGEADEMIEKDASLVAMMAAFGPMK
jgi:hypothetical protein